MIRERDRLPDLGETAHASRPPLPRALVDLFVPQEIVTDLPHCAVDIEANKIPHEDHAFLGQGTLNHCALFLREGVAVGHVI